jgi:non-lysosomal glucosylceramidase
VAGPSSIDPLHQFGPDAVAVSFPLGGVGTGNVSLGARGDLRDWELEEEPATGNLLPNAAFGLWLGGGASQAIRILEGPFPASPRPSHGRHPSTQAGIPRFGHSRFTGTYPVARVQLWDDELPVTATIEAWTPLVPLDPEESGIPVAVFDVSLTNRGTEELSSAVSLSLANPVGRIVHDPFGTPIGTRFGRTINRSYHSEHLTGVVFANADLTEADLAYGELAILTDAAGATVKPVWRRGGWWDELRSFWQEFGVGGTLHAGADEGPSDGKPDTGSVAAPFTIPGGATTTHRFYLAWYFPNRRRGWCSPQNIPQRWEGGTVPLVKKHYTNRFESAVSAAEYAHAHRRRLDDTTFRFRDALFSSTLPAAMIRAVAANIVPLRSQTCFWLADGGFYGWEGCFDDAGCCAGTCTHVWSYAYTGAYLFPSLERCMRSVEFGIETDQRGLMSFRAHRALGEDFIWQWEGGPQPAIDGQMGSIVRLWREYTLSGDRAWLEQLWPGLERATSFAIRWWDPDGIGLVGGSQHNTYDIEFWGPNPLGEFVYLAGLHAAARIAAVLGYHRQAETWRAIAEAGTVAADECLWSGDYYLQPGDEASTHPYQHGRGCLSDQLLGHVHAVANHLPPVVEEGRARAAYRAIHRANFRREMTRHVNYQRTYAVGDEGGLVLCTWPDGGEPDLPFPYSDEVWSGVEYHVAAGMIHAGLAAEAIEIVDTVARRHDGINGNPWDEVECGHHYARAMASWLMLLMASGQRTTPDHALSFAPSAILASAEGSRCFYSDGRSWGVLEVNDGGALLRVMGGALPRSVDVDGGLPVVVVDAREDEI